MPIVVSVLVAARSLVRSRAALHLEILALRHQLQVLERSHRSRVRLTTADRLLWVWPRASGPTGQKWRTFLANHIGQAVAADFFVVPTVTYRLLFVLVLLAHDRRRVVHVAVTEQPTSAWTAQQLRNAFPHDGCPSYLLHDHDAVFAGVGSTIAGMRIQAVVTAPRSSWQNRDPDRWSRSQPNIGRNPVALSWLLSAPSILFPSLFGLI